MATRPTFFHLLLALLASAAVASPMNFVFTGDTSFQGSIKNIDPKAGTLTVHSEDLIGESQLNLDGLLEIKFDHEAPTHQAAHHAILKSKPRHAGRPRDTLHGTLAAITTDSITLNTHYAGPLVLEREMISELSIFPNSRSSYSGPIKLSNWTITPTRNTSSWSLKNRALISNGTAAIARQIPSPKRLHLSFRASWEGNPNFSLAFLTDDGTTIHPEVGYRLNVSQNYITIIRNGPGRKRREQVARGSSFIQGNTTAKFDLYLDKERTGQNGLFIEGRRISTWAGTDDMEGMGNWIQFVPRNNETLTFSSITVHEWDGRLPQSGSTNELLKELADLKGERIDLANGDVLKAEITGVTTHELQTTTAYGDISIPLERVRSIDVGGKIKDEPQPRMWTEDVRAWLHEGGFIHIRLSEMTDNTLRGTSQVFRGEANFDLSAFSRIEFNIWRSELDLEHYGKHSPR